MVMEAESPKDLYSKQTRRASAVSSSPSSSLREQKQTDVPAQRQAEKERILPYSGSIQAFSGLNEAHPHLECSLLYSVYRFKSWSHPETPSQTHPLMLIQYLDPLAQSSGPLIKLTITIFYLKKKQNKASLLSLHPLLSNYSSISSLLQWNFSEDLCLSTTASSLWSLSTQ